MKQVIKDFPNYEITASGKVLSAYKNGVELIPRVNKGGYLYVNLYNENGRKTKKIHRLVAEAFIPNTDNLPQVNHKDGNKLNNHVENLEWCDAGYNARHAVDNGLTNYYSNARKEASISNGKLFGGRGGRKIYAMNVKSGFIKEFDSVIKTAEAFGVSDDLLRRIIKKGKCINGYQVWYADTLATTMDEAPNVKIGG